MSHLLDSAVHRIPVGMNIHNAHKYRNHQTTIMEILVFIDFLDYDDFPVGRRNDYFLSVLPEETDRTTEEIHH